MYSSLYTSQSAIFFPYFLTHKDGGNTEMTATPSHVTLTSACWPTDAGPDGPEKCTDFLVCPGIVPEINTQFWGVIPHFLTVYPLLLPSAEIFMLISGPAGRYSISMSFRSTILFLVLLTIVAGCQVPEQTVTYDPDPVIDILKDLQTANTTSAPLNPLAVPIGAGLTGIIAMLEALRRVERGKRKYAEHELNNNKDSHT